MSTYIVTFEINNQQRKDNFKKKLKEYDACCPIHDSAWAIYTDKKDLEIINEIKNTIIPEDRLFVMETSLRASWVNPYGNEHSDWLKKNL